MTSISVTRFASCLLAPLLALVLAAPTRAAEPTGPEFEAGVALYTDLEFEQALFRFQRVAADSALSDEERAITFLWIAMCYGGLSDTEGAKRALIDARRLDADAPLPQYAMPRIQELYADTPAPEPPPPTDVTAPPAEEPGVPGVSTTDEPTPTGQPEGSMPVGLYAGAATGGVAALLLVSAAVVGALAGVTLADANALAEDPSTYQKDVVERVDLATIEGGIAAGLGVAGVGVGAAAVAVFVLMGDE